MRVSETRGSRAEGASPKRGEPSFPQGGGAAGDDALTRCYAPACRLRRQRQEYFRRPDRRSQSHSTVRVRRGRPVYLLRAGTRLRLSRNVFTTVSLNEECSSDDTTALKVLDDSPRQVRQALRRNACRELCRFRCSGHPSSQKSCQRPVSHPPAAWWR